MDRHIVIVGAGAAGLTVAEELRRRGYDDALTLIGAEQHPPYDRPPLSKRFLDGRTRAEQLRLISPEALDRLEATVRTGRRVIGTDPAARTVALDDHTALTYTDLVIATGVAPRTFPGTAELPGVMTLKTLDDARILSARLRPQQRLVVVGGGFLGTEAAWTGLAIGCEVTVVTPTPTVLPALGDQVGAIAGERLTAAGASVLSGGGVEGVRRHDAPQGAGEVEVLLSDGTRLCANTVLTAIGSVPDVDWCTGGDLDLADGIVCDAVGRAATNVHACGDVASWYCPPLGEHVRLEHRMHASAQARVIAADLLGERLELDWVPFFWTDQGPSKIVVHGMITPEAEFEVHEFDEEHDRFTGVYREDGVVRAVLGWNAPKQILRLRRELLTRPAASTTEGALLAGAPRSG